MMEQVKHVTGKNQLKSLTRSTARHLRRKRLQDARRAEKQQEHLIDRINSNSNQESIIEKDSDQSEVNEIVTKPSTSRLRKQNEAKGNRSFYRFSFTESLNQEDIPRKDIGEIETITKSKARRLRKKSKNKKLLETEQNPENIELQDNFSEYSCLIRSPIEILKTACEIHSFFYNLETQLKNRKKFPSKYISKKKKPRLQRLYSKQFNEFENLSSLRELAVAASFVRFYQNIEHYSIEYDKEQNFGIDSVYVLDDIENAEFNDYSEFKMPESKLPIDYFTPVRNTDRLLSEINLSENTEVETPAIVPIKMVDNKVSVPEKSREEIKAEREAKKTAKALAKAKAKSAKTEAKSDSNNKSVGIKDKQSNETDSIRNKQSKETSKDKTKENIEPSNKTNIINKSANCTEAEVAREGKSNAELRAERRAKQEAQRAAKQQLLIDKSKVKNKKVDNENESVTQSVATHTVQKVTTPKKTVQKDNTHEINLFKHLYHEREQAIVHVPFVNSNIHLAIVRLGTQYASKVIVGSNARCVALLAAVKQLIWDFERPSQADFIRGLEATLQESIAYLHHCRPLAVSMQNALKHLKWQMTQLPSALSDADAKSKLCNAIDTYILEQIELAGKAISLTIQTKISNGDVILTYGYSSLIHKILLDAHTAKKQFRVIVVDGRPWLEGKEQLRRLAKHGIECSYILINALSYMMPEVSKVFLGAHAILANGAVMSRVGTAQVALMARAFNIPVLVACETHKSCERVQTDSIVCNELGNADDLVQDCRNGLKKSLLTNWRAKKSLNLLNITYDVTPADLVTAVVTELAILPCTSVPVILRIKPSEI